MKVAVVGAGAVGGYYGAMLARGGHAVTLIARGAHLEAIKAGGLRVVGPGGAFTAPVAAAADPAAVGRADLVLFAVKTYDNPSALPLLATLVGPDSVVLTLQNGVESPDEAASVVGRDRVLGGAAYIATALAAPGVIEQTGTHHRVVFGEVFDARAALSERVERIRDAFARAGVEADAVPDARVPLWEKYIYLAPFAGLTGAARSAIGPLWRRPETGRVLMRACAEVEAVARAEGIAVPADIRDRIRQYVDSLPPTTRSSLLIDLQRGKRIEVEALQGTLVRRASRLGIDTPVMDTFYAVLREHGGPGA
jgi:2-dehydropantoate 2-reductase